MAARTESDPMSLVESHIWSQSGLERGALIFLGLEVCRDVIKTFLTMIHNNISYNVFYYIRCDKSLRK